MIKKIFFICLLLNSLYFSFGQCTYTGSPLTPAGSPVIFCVDNSNTQTIAGVAAGQYALVNVIKGFTYTFSVGNYFTDGTSAGDENITILDAATNGNVSPAAFVTNNVGASITWTATLSGQIKVLFSKGACNNNGDAGGTMTLVLNTIGNTQDSETAAGTNTWIGHIYNWTGTPPPGGTVPPTAPVTTTPFSAAQYVGYYNVPTETFNEGFGGNTNCVSVLSNGVIRTNISAETFAVRYRMVSTRAAGCYMLRMYADDGVRVYVDNVLIASSWRDQGLNDFTNMLVYLNGNSTIVLDYYENSGGQVVGFNIAPFDAASNTITPATSNTCSGVSPSVLNGSAYQYNGATINPTIAFQWQNSTDNVTFTNITGATLEDYTPPAQTTSGSNIVRYYRRIVTAVASNATTCTSTSASVTVNTVTTAPAIGSISGNATICSSVAGLVYTVTYPVPGATFTWAVPPGFTITAGTNTNSITVTASSYTQTGNITVFATTSCGTTATATYAVSVVGGSIGGTVSGTTPICLNGSTTLNLTGQTGNVVRWEKRLLPATAWTNINITTATLTESIAQAGTWEYRAGVINLSCPEVRSSIFTVVVNPLLTITMGTNPSFCQGTFSGVNFPYSATTVPPNQGGWVLTFDAAAVAVGFQATSNGSLTATSGTIPLYTVPGAAPIGTYNGTISVNTNNPICSSVTFPVSVTVGSVVGTITLSSAAGTNIQSKCINTAITPITYSTTNATGATITGLPAGVTGVYASNAVTISGTPTVSGTFNYSVALTGTCNAPSQTGTLTVGPGIPVVPAVANQVVCNGALNPATFLVLNGSVCNRVNEGSNLVFTAPQGTVFTAVNFASYGTSTGTTCATYALGTCHGANSTSVVSGFLIGQNTATIAATNGVFGDPCGGTFKTLAVDASFSNSGVTFSWTNSNAAIGLAASGTGNVSAFTAVNNTSSPIVATISITASQGGCVSAVTTYTITVNPVNTINLTSTAGTNAQTVCNASPITAITYATTGATSATFSGLPTGVTGAWNANVVTISGTPSVTGTFNYTVTLVGGCGGGTATGSIVVNTATVAGTVSGGTTVCNGATSGLLTLSGQTGAVVRWESSTDNFATNTPIANTTTTYTSGVLTQATLFRAVVQNSGCTALNSVAALVTTGPVSTWNGTAWSIAPTITNSLVFQGSYASNAAIEGCNCIVQNPAVVTIQSGGSMRVQDFVRVVSGGSLTFQNNAPLVQINDGAVNSGNITVNRNSSLLKRLDYTLWSSPVANQGLTAFSPATIANRIYTYNATSTGSTAFPITSGIGAYSVVSGSFGLGRGYLIRMPNNHPTTATVWNGVFSGVPNNGVVNVSLNTGGQGFNSIGNPYPSPINLSTFFSVNSTVGSTAYLWRRTNDINLVNNSGYATWTSGTFVTGANYTGSGVFTGVLQTGQGFVVKATGGSVVFNNSMRAVNTANQFFRGQADERHTVWLNLSNPAGDFAQMATGYRTNASNAVDSFDGLNFNDGNLSIGSYLDKSNYIIQGRALPFDAADVIPLTFKTSIDGNYTIAIDHADGMFTDSQAVYLKDVSTNTITDLRTNAYSFATLAGTVNNRFELVFQRALKNDTSIANEAGIVVYKNNFDIVVNCGNSNIKNVKIYDIRGRLLLEKLNINATEIRMNLLGSSQIILVKTTLDDGQVITKKVIY